VILLRGLKRKKEGQHIKKEVPLFHVSLPCHQKKKMTAFRAFDRGGEERLTPESRGKEYDLDHRPIRGGANKGENSSHRFPERRGGFLVSREGVVL